MSKVAHKLDLASRDGTDLSCHAAIVFSDDDKVQALSNASTIDWMTHSGHEAAIVDLIDSLDAAGKQAVMQESGAFLKRESVQKLGLG